MQFRLRASSEAFGERPNGRCNRVFLWELRVECWMWNKLWSLTLHVWKLEPEGARSLPQAPQMESRTRCPQSPLCPSVTQTQSDWWLKNTLWHSSPACSCLSLKLFFIVPYSITGCFRHDCLSWKDTWRPYHEDGVTLVSWLTPLQERAVRELMSGPGTPTLLTSRARCLFPSHCNISGIRRAF